MKFHKNWVNRNIGFYDGVHRNEDERWGYIFFCCERCYTAPWLVKGTEIKAIYYLWYMMLMLNPIRTKIVVMKFQRYIYENFDFFFSLEHNWILIPLIENQLVL